MGSICGGQHLRYTSRVQVIRTYTYTFLNFNDLSTILSGHNLAFSTFQHRLASFNLPEIPIFVLARPVSHFFLVGNPDHFQFYS